MTDTLKVLGQIVPTNNLLTILYTVPNNTQTTISSLVVCNQSSTTGTLFSISVAIGGEVDSPKQYLYKNIPLDINDTFVATIGMLLTIGDEIRCLSIEDNVSFNLFGLEIT